MSGLHNLGFVATRLAGTDGVTLEAMKWADFFEKHLNLRCYYFAGELETPPDRSLLVPEAFFRHPEVREIHDLCFGRTVRDRDTTQRIQKLKEHLKDKLYEFLDLFSLDILVVENALAIPVNIPLGLALAEFISETGIPTVAHHHDFFWERQRFLTNAIWEYINMAFPPHIPHIHHVVINSSQDNQLSLRTGISATIIPNVMDFEHPPAPPDEYSSDIRSALGLEPDELFVLQPTRVVPRKGIEHAIELVSRLGLKARLVISHASGDEGFEYEQRVREYAAMMHVRTLFVADIIKDHRGTTSDGRKIYTLADAYHHADLVTYPSTYEGFGNAFLEAVYFKKPIVVNTYSTYRTDIKPKGFRAIEFDGYITEKTLRETREILQNREKRIAMVERNYELGLRFYSFAALHRKLATLFSAYLAMAGSSV